MRKAKSLLGLNVLSKLDGKHLGTVRDLLIDTQARRVIGLLISDRDLFGLIDAQAVPYDQIRKIGPDAVMVPFQESLVKVHEFAPLALAYDQKVQLEGQKVTTQMGQELGRVNDLYLAEDGSIQGCEISGGLVMDLLSGKHYIDLPPETVLSTDHILVPGTVSEDLERKRQENPGGVAGAYRSVAISAGELKNSAVNPPERGPMAPPKAPTPEEERSFAIGRVALVDVYLPSPPDGHDSGLEVFPPVTIEEAAESPAITIPSSNDLLIREGETVTAWHAEMASKAGVLHELYLATGGEYAGEPNTAAELLSASAIGKPMSHDVKDNDGKVVASAGTVVTPEILERAAAAGRRLEVIAAANLGAASESLHRGYQELRQGTGSLWQQIKEKTSELTGAAQEKKAELDESKLRQRINGALGRPVTRVILDSEDNVILNSGDLITNAAVAQARRAGVIDILLDSVFVAQPQITQDMLRVQDPGRAALPNQAQPSGEPVDWNAPLAQPSGQNVQPSPGGQETANPETETPHAQDEDDSHAPVNADQPQGEREPHLAAS